MAFIYLWLSWIRILWLNQPLKIRPLSGLMATDEIILSMTSWYCSLCTTADGFSSDSIPNASAVFHIKICPFPSCLPPTTMKLSSLDISMAQMKSECDNWNAFGLSGPVMKQLLAKRLSFDGFFVPLKSRSRICFTIFDILFLSSKNWWRTDQIMDSRKDWWLVSKIWK